MITTKLGFVLAALRAGPGERSRTPVTIATASAAKIAIFRSAPQLVLEARVFSVEVRIGIESVKEATREVLRGIRNYKQRRRANDAVGTADRCPCRTRPHRHRRSLGRDDQGHDGAG